MLNRKTTILPVTREPIGPQYDSSTKLGNWDKNRVDIDTVVIHTMVGTAEGASARFNDPKSNVSATYGVRLSGEIWQWLDEDLVAYQAGKYSVNQKSIGIEHEDNGNFNGVRPDSLYLASAQLVADICKFYGIPCDRQHVLKHSEIVATGCPDALDVERIVTTAAKLIAPPQNGPQPVNDNTLLDLTPIGNEADGTPYKVEPFGTVKAKIKAKDQNIVSLTGQNEVLARTNVNLLAENATIKVVNSGLAQKLKDAQTATTKVPLFVRRWFGDKV